jgi:4-hydroxy-tetrahydrodipicolinate reductase
MSKKIRVGIVGAGGRMGREIESVVREDSDLSVGALVGRNNEAGMKSLSTLDASFIDVIIDFTQAESFDEVLGWCVANGIPLISGTTGLAFQQIEALQKYKSRLPIFWAPNMSLGIALMSKMLGDLAKLPDADFQIEEHHHRFKKDRPSGTAQWLQQELASHVSSDLPEPLVVRGGGVFGVHKAYALALEEVLVLEHVALNRSVFAKGAVRAAKWVFGKKPGLYNMKDLVSGH